MKPLTEIDKLKSRIHKLKLSTDKSDLLNTELSAELTKKNASILNLVSEISELKAQLADTSKIDSLSAELKKLSDELISKQAMIDSLSALNDETQEQLFELDQVKNSVDILAQVKQLIN